MGGEEGGEGGGEEGEEVGGGEGEGGRGEGRGERGEGRRERGKGTADKLQMHGASEEILDERASVVISLTNCGAPESCLAATGRRTMNGGAKKKKKA